MAALALFVLAPACSGSDKPEPVTLSFGHPFRADSAMLMEVFEKWASDVNAATGGSVTIELHPEGILSAAPETYASVVAGGQDIGWSLQGYTQGRFPVSGVIEMPFVFDGAAQATNVLWGLYDGFEALRDEYSDVKLLGLWTSGPGDLWIADGTVSTIADLEGRSIRTPGPVQATVVAALGAVPVHMALTEVNDALQAGEIDGLVTPSSAITGFDLTGELDSVVECGCYVSASFLAMNLDSWNMLSSDQQTALEELSGRHISIAAAKFQDEPRAENAALIAAAGIVKTRLVGDERNRWREATQEVVEDWITHNVGYLDSRSLYESMVELAASQ